MPNVDLLQSDQKSAILELDRSRLFEMRVNGRFIGVCDPFAGIIIITMFGRQWAFDLKEMRRDVRRRCDETKTT